jgi:hypothetical protein
MEGSDRVMTRFKILSSEGAEDTVSSFKTKPVLASEVSSKHSRFFKSRFIFPAELSLNMTF